MSREKAQRKTKKVMAKSSLEIGDWRLEIGYLGFQFLLSEDSFVLAVEVLGGGGGLSAGGDDNGAVL